MIQKLLKIFENPAFFGANGHFQRSLALEQNFNNQTILESAHFRPPSSDLLSFTSLKSEKKLA